MKPRAIGIVAGGGGPMGSSSVLRDIISECQKKYNSRRSYEYPCINFHSYPYAETMLPNNPTCIPSRELSYCIQQLKLIGMEIIVVPCFTMSSYLTYRSYGVELIETGAMMRLHLEKNKIKNPLVLCSDRTRMSGYCNQYFECHYPNDQIQREVALLIEEALTGEKIDVLPLLSKLPDVPILCAMTTLNAQMEEIDDPRWINSNKLMAEYVVYRSYEGKVDDEESLQTGFIEIQRDAAMSS
jgi:aspartate/glutamate racemase